MIEMPLFEDEDWFLQIVKSLLVDGRIRDIQKCDRVCNEKLQEINDLLAEIICDEDFSNENCKYTLFEKIILAPYEDLRKIHDKLDGRAEDIFIDQVRDDSGKVKKVIKSKWRSIYSLYDKFISRGFNTQLVQKYGIKCCPYCNENYIINRK